VLLVWVEGRGATCAASVDGREGEKKMPRLTHPSPSGEASAPPPRLSCNPSTPPHRHRNRHRHEQTATGCGRVRG
jgi:hypothetical protein